MKARALVDRVTSNAAKFYQTTFGTVLATTTNQKQQGVFKAQKFTTTTTGTTLAAPDGDGSIELTDLIISFEKKNTAEITIRYNDGSNTETIWFGDATDGLINIAVSFQGKWQGWKGAYVEVVIANAALDGSIGLGFIKHNEADSLSYSEWNARR